MTDLPVRILAVIGAAAAGALVLTAVLQLLVKVLFRQKLPPWPIWGIRVLGGVLCGWLVALWLFGGGGGGIGGGGGFGLGAGPSTEKDKDRTVSEKSDKDKDKEGKAKKEPPPVTEKETLRVEVLGDAPLKKIAKSANFDGGKRYRLAGEANLRTLEEVKNVIRKRREEKPSLKQLEVVLYLDSPERQRPQVAMLHDWATDLDEQGGKLLITFSEMNRYAPLE